jgi:hypothetical protein
VRNNNLTIKLRLLKGIGIALLSGFLISCAAINAQNIEDKEELLAAAGFKIQLADTPEKLAHLKTLTQQKIVTHEKDGKNYYVYADATTCQCLYIGQDSDYQSFQQLQIQKQIAHDEKMSAEMNENATMDWNIWGPGYGMNGYY